MHLLRFKNHRMGYVQTWFPCRIQCPSTRSQLKLPSVCYHHAQFSSWVLFKSHMFTFISWRLPNLSDQKSPISAGHDCLFLLYLTCNIVLYKQYYCGWHTSLLRIIIIIMIYMHVLTFQYWPQIVDTSGKLHQMTHPSALYKP